MPARATRTSPGSARTPPPSASRCSERADLAMLAVQGPEARAKAAQLLQPARGRARRSPCGTFVGCAARRLVRGAHRLHRRGRLRDHDAGARRGAGCGSSLNALGVASCGLGRARHAAPGGRHEPLRQRHGREHPPVRVGPRLDGGVRAARARLHRPRGARGDASRAARRASSSACCWRSAACCAVTRRWWCPASARARSPAAPSRRRSSARSRWRACRPATARQGAGRHPRQAPARAGGQAAVRAHRQGPLIS